MNIRRPLLPLAKYAVDRSQGWDFLAGVDPTGTKTFQYGISDAEADKSEAASRLTIGVLGGLIGGGLLVPAGITAIIGAAKGAAHGPKGAVTGLVEGFTRPVRQIQQGRAGASVLRKIEEGTKLTMGDVSSLQRALKMIPFAEKSNALNRAAKKSLPLLNAALKTVPPEAARAMSQKFQGAVNEAVTGLLLSGLVGASSAALQYSRGREMGRVLSAEQRKHIEGGG